MTSLATRQRLPQPHFKRTKSVTPSVVPLATRAWIPTASGWNRWGRMETEPSTGTSTVLACTRRSRSGGKQIGAGRRGGENAETEVLFGWLTSSARVSSADSARTRFYKCDFFTTACRCSLQQRARRGTAAREKETRKTAEEEKTGGLSVEVSGPPASASCANSTSLGKVAMCRPLFTSPEYIYIYLV